MAVPRHLSDTLEVAAHEVRFALGAVAASISEIHRDKGIISTLVNVGELAPGEVVRPEDEIYLLADYPMMAVLIDEARSWVIDSENPADDPSEREFMRGIGKRYGLAAPILLDGRIWGELFVSRNADDVAFTSDDCLLAEALSAVLAAGVGQTQRMQMIEHMAFEDPLTGLANRRALDLALERALDAHYAEHGPVAVLMADVNGLKTMNDLHGHEAGDRLLSAVGNAFASAASQYPNAVVGRMGGDEFCVVLAGVDVDGAAALAAAVLRSLDGGPYEAAVACGVASTSTMPEGEQPTARALLRLSDEAQYAAKRAHASRAYVAGTDVEPDLPTERRRIRGARKAGIADLLTAGLRAAASADRSTAARLVASLSAVADALQAPGWVLSRDDGTSTQTIAFAQDREGLRTDTAISTADDPEWLHDARRTGLLVVATPGTPSLAATRGSARVAVAGAGEWLLEILGDTTTALDDVPGVLRALAGSALVE